MSESLWVIIEADGMSNSDQLVGLARTFDAVKEYVADYEDNDGLEWVSRNSMFDFQDYYVARAEYTEYHTYQMGIEQ